MMSPSSSLAQAVRQFVDEKAGYYWQWVFDNPFIISQERDQDFHRIQKIIYSLACEFVERYWSYKDLMPLSEKAERVLEIFRSKPYQPGTYRTDFVFDSHGTPRLIEITCRFALNAFFESAIYYKFALRASTSQFPNTRFSHREESLFPYLESLYSGNDEILVLKGSDAKNSSRIFLKIFQDTGIPVTEIHYSDLALHQGRLKNAWVISELTLDEIESLTDSVLETLSESNLINDYRTVFLLHDKRFFHVIQDPELQRACLSEADRDFISQHLIPTYRYGVAPECWNAAQRHREEWILKPCSLGKSQGIYAGALTSEKDWEKLFHSPEISNFVLQQWVPQRQWSGTVQQKEYSDYITGTLLFLNNEYFGFGPMRASSYPISNVVDDRKIATIALAQPVSKDMLNRDFISI